MEKKSCDVVVIGSGIGGLCLAARLAHSGYKTIVLEKMPTIGGRYPYTDYKGYHVPVAAMYIYYGEKDPVLLTLGEVGGDTSFERKPLPQPKWRINGIEHELPEKGALFHLLSLTSRDKDEEERVRSALKRAFRWQEPSDYITFSEWLLHLTDNKTTYNMLNALCTQVLGPNIWEYPAGEFFRQLKNMIGTSLVAPKDGLNVVTDGLADVIRRGNGEILTTTGVRKILVRDGMATGVDAKSDEGALQIEAKMVVSNVGPRRTVELAGVENFDRGYLQQVKEIPIHTGFAFFLSSNEPLYDYPGGLYTIDTRRMLIWIDCTVTWPHWAPKGKHYMLCYQAPKHLSLYDPREEYELFLADLADTFPHFNQQGGEILSAHQYRGDWPIHHAIPGHDLTQKTPVENLYNVGDGVKPPGWLAGSGAAESGRIVAEDIMSRIKISG